MVRSSLIILLVFLGASNALLGPIINIAGTIIGGWNESECQGNIYEIKGMTNGTIRNSIGPIDGEYYNYEECRWVVTARPGYKVRFYFKLVDLENCWTSKCGCDWVEIHDGAFDNYPVIAKFCEDAKPTTWFKTSDNQGMIHFHTDNRYQHKGFEVYFEEVQF